MKEIQAPKFVNNKIATIFLAGSIDMGTAEEWQKRAVSLLASNPRTAGFTALNPRRADWDNSWKQDISDPQFYEQVTWELQGIEECEWAIVYFDKNSSSPITLMELGILSQLAPEKAIVICPEGFYRKGNVDIVCHRYRIRCVKSLEEAITLIGN